MQLVMHTDQDQGTNNSYDSDTDHDENNTNHTASDDHANHF